MNSYPKLQVCMKFAKIVTGLVFLSYWISDNVFLSGLQKSPVMLCLNDPKTSLNQFSKAGNKC